MKKAQSTIEYVILVAIGLLLVVAVYLLVRQSLFTPTMDDATNYSGQITNLTASIMPS